MRLSKLALLIVIILSFAFSSINKSPNRFLKNEGFELIQSAGSTDYYISATEITNKQYLLFLNDLKAANNTKDLAIAMVDSLQWQNEFSYNAPYTNYYFRHIAYENYPVVNISYDAAILYCNWLQLKYQKSGYDVIVRLPTEAEWINAAKGGNANNIYGWDGNDLTDKKGNYLCNFAVQDSTNDILTPVKSFKPNKLGLYNMSGNVAEMLSIKGAHKGGSWNNAIELLKIDAVDPYTGISSPLPTIGFRPLIELNITAN